MARRSLRVAAFAAALTLFALPLRAEEKGTDLVGRVQLSGKDGTDVAIITSSGTYDLHWQMFLNTWVRPILFGQDGQTVKLHVQIEQPAAPGKNGRAYADGIYGRAKRPTNVVADESDGDKPVERTVDHLKVGEVVIVQNRFIDLQVQTDRGNVGWVGRFALEYGGFSDNPQKAAKPTQPAPPTGGLLDPLGDHPPEPAQPTRPAPPTGGMIDPLGGPGNPLGD
jgi:hypothetical protein